MRTGSTALRSIVDILVAGGLDERIEEITQPASHETGPVLPLLRHANRLTRDLGHLAACQLATANQLDRTLASRSAPPAEQAQPSPAARQRRSRAMVRLDLSTLLVLLAMAAYAGVLIGDLASRTPPPWSTYVIPAPLPPPPAPAKPPAGHINAALPPPAPPAPTMPPAS